MPSPLWILPLGLAFAVLAPPAKAPSTFPTQVRPLLQHRCMPCHFEGGTMYAKLPFDRPAMVRSLGERLFTRLKDPDEQRIIRTFLAEPPEADPEPESAPEPKP